MDEDMADEAAGGAERRPAATTCVAVIVGPFLWELRTGRAITRPVAHVQMGFDGYEDEFTAVLARRCVPRKTTALPSVNGQRAFAGL
jgi:hypothetical protein